MYVAKVDVLVVSPAEDEWSKHTNEHAVVDTCKLLLSPMPGTLINYAVKVRSRSFIIFIIIFCIFPSYNFSLNPIVFPANPYSNFLCSNILGG